MGTVIEAQLDRGRGPVATVLVRNGTLRVGDFFICGAVFGKVRAMQNDRGAQIRKAEPSTPVEVLGLDSLPEAGDDFQVVTDTAKAKQIVKFRDQKVREAALAKSSRLTLEQLHKQMEAGEVKELPIIIKTDVGGSAEVLTETLQKLSNEKVKVRVIHSGVGAINESDVLLASASNAIIIGFNVRPERNAAALAEQEKVDIRLHTIIYNLTDEIKRAMTGLLEPVFKEVYRGKAEVRETFRITKVGNVAGCHGAGRRDHARLRSAAAARQRGGVHRQDRLAAPLQGRRQRGQERHGVRHHAGELRRRQAGRRHRGLRHRARGHRSLRLIAMAAIGVLTLELRLENSHSLKEKRHVVQSLKDRLRNKFNVAVAEIDYQDLWQRAAVAAVTVSSDHVHAEKVLRSVEDEAAALLGGGTGRSDSGVAGVKEQGLGVRGRGLGNRARRSAVPGVACTQPYPLAPNPQPPAFHG